jgi:hypothetical protein
MASSVVCGWEFGPEPAEIPYMLQSAGIYFRTSSSSLGNNPPLQNQSICENWGKCTQTCEPRSGIFSSALMRQDLLVADSIYLPWNEAYWQFLSVPCWEQKPNGRHFRSEISLKVDSGRNCCVLRCCMLHACRFRVHYWLLLIHRVQRSAPCRFWVQCSFSSYFFTPAMDTSLLQWTSIKARHSIKASWFSFTMHDSLVKFYTRHVRRILADPS